MDIIKDDVVYMHKQTVWADSVNRNNPHGKSLFSLDYPQVKSKKNSTKYSHYMMVNNDYYVFIIRFVLNISKPLSILWILI